MPFQFVAAANLRPFGAPPSRGRRECPRKPLPLEGAAERSEAGLASFFGGKAASSLPSPRGEGCVSGIAVFSFRSLPHWGRGTASAVDRVLSYIACLRRISPLIFHTASTLSAPSGYLPLEGKALFVDSGFLVS